MVGWVSESRKGINIPLKKDAWVPILRFDNVPFGPTIFHAQFYGTLPSIKPKDIETKWIRLNDVSTPVDDDPTGRVSHTVGSKLDWAGKDTNMEYVNEGDSPVELWIRHNATTTWSITTVIQKYLTVPAYIADRIKVG